MALLSYTIGHFFIDIYAGSSDALLLTSFIDVKNFYIFNYLFKFIIKLFK